MTEWMWTEDRKRFLNDVEDRLFSLVMHEAAMEEGEAFLAESAVLHADTSLQPTSDARHTFERLLRIHLRRERQTAHRGIPEAISRVAMAVAVLLIVFVTSMLTVEAVRIRVLNFMLDVQKECTTITLEPPEESGEKAPSLGPNWRGCYQLTYIPNGYTLDSAENKDVLKQLVYKNEREQYIVYGQFSSSSSVSVDTENAKVTNIQINGFDGILIEKDDHVSVVWNDGQSIFTLLTWLTPEEALRVAQGVKVVE